MKQLLAWTGSADSTITSEAVMAMAEKFNTGQEVCLQIPSARGVMQVKEGTSGSIALCVSGLTVEVQRWRTSENTARMSGPTGGAIFRCSLGSVRRQRLTPSHRLSFNEAAAVKPSELGARSLTVTRSYVNGVSTCRSKPLPALRDSGFVGRRSQAAVLHATTQEFQK
jgi:hypothetical protein